MSSSLSQSLRSIDGYSGVEAAIHVFSDDECAAARAVVSATPVVLDPATELGEYQDGHLVGCVVLAQVSQEVGDGGGQFG